MQRLPCRIKDPTALYVVRMLSNQHYINNLSFWHSPCSLYKVTHENNALTTSVLNE